MLARSCRVGAALAVVLAGGGCDLRVLSSQAGEHVVYHWDPDHVQLCGGTVPATDAVVAGIPRRYGLTLADHEGGPTIDYFWSAGHDYSLSLCSWGRRAEACALYDLAAGVAVYSKTPIHGHELAHAALHSTNKSLSVPYFIDEGFASRWVSVILASEGPAESPYVSLTEARLREQLSGRHAEIDYTLAHAWWATLEAYHGPAAMAVLLVALEHSMSADELDAILRERLGTSLAESAELTTRYGGALSFDDPACMIEGLPSFTWTGEPIVLDRGPANCADPDIINHNNHEAVSLFEILLPDIGSELAVDFVGLEHNQRASALVVECDAGVSFSYGPGWAHSGQPNRFWLRRRALIAPIGALQSDGTVELPRVRVSEGWP